MAASEKGTPQAQNGRGSVNAGFIAALRKKDPYAANNENWDMYSLLLFYKARAPSSEPFLHPGSTGSAGIQLEYMCVQTPKTLNPQTLDQGSFQRIWVLFWGPHYNEDYRSWCLCCRLLFWKLPKLHNQMSCSLTLYVGSIIGVMKGDTRS